MTRSWRIDTSDGEGQAMSKILIIDDDMSFISVLQLYLRGEGNEVHAVRNAIASGTTAPVKSASPP